MAFGSIKADNIIYDDGTQEVTTSVQTLSTAVSSITTNATNISANSTSITNNATAIATNASNIALKADLNDPDFTGTPTCPNVAAGTNNTEIANTAYVDTAIANVVNSAPAALDTLNELATALGNDANFSTTVTNSIADKLPLAGGTLTGAVTAQSDVTFQDAIVMQRVKEKVNVFTAGAIGATAEMHVKTQGVYYATNAQTANWTLNLVGDGSNTLDSLMSTGQATTITYLMTYGATAYYITDIQIDGATNNRTLKWVGGAPTSAGTANSICAVTATVIKTAANTFTVLASKVEFE